jgi:hypothetical protein
MVLGPACIDLDSLRPPPDAGSAPAPAAPGSGGVTAPGIGGGTNPASASSGGAGGTYRPSTVSVVVADFDGNGQNESIVIDNSTGKARIFSAGGEARGSEAPGKLLGRVVFVDLDGDGSTDLAFISNAPDHPIQLTVLLNDPVEGGFTLSRTYEMIDVSNGDIPPVLLARDLDGDGQLDLQVSGDGVDVMFNTGRGIFLKADVDSVKKVSGEAIAGCPGCRIVLPVPGE